MDIKSRSGVPRQVKRSHKKKNKKSDLLKMTRPKFK